MTHIGAKAVTFEPEFQTADLIETIMGDADNVIACLDANRICNLRELLEASGLEHQCMFRGALAREAADAAPWLVRLRRDDKLLRQLLTSAGPKGDDAFAFLEAEPGIFIHSDLSLDALRRHLRRFLRVATGEGKFFLFRFWEPLIARTYFEGINDRPDLIQRWFLCREGGDISGFAVPLCSPNDMSVVQLRPENLPTSAIPPSGLFKLTNGDVVRFREARLMRDRMALAMRLRDTFPQAAEVHSSDSLYQFVSESMTRMMEFGFSKKALLFTLLAWDLHYGPKFEGRDVQGQLAQILATAGPEKERFAQLKARMSQIG